MRSFLYLFFGIVLFYIDITIGLIIPFNIGNHAVKFVPQLTLMYLLMLTVYRNFGISLILGTFLGIMTDIYIGSLYGIYMFGYILLIFIIDKFFKVFYRDYIMIFFVIICATLVFQMYAALIYGAVGFIEFDIWDFILLRLLPTFILNLILLIIMFPICYKYLKN
ncbi:rod shape-determining protein MreD [Staphylococcus lugdunensis]|jgi:rod shape-determining protein MreD|uniref:Rod shape-determining protein MreD n=1 Tax=Staphylococcus lugdunensis TaxID=28035 RepID=A0A133Q2F2_STALU|nr:MULTISPECIES: rod shape-determining protein MreD [Staphylococcus]ADC87364.1 Rod shape-determining protein MreD [Staphylococcus lugdunensis HKU09-01]AMG60505.1 rod shape-determining protein MreD [Staphylococcus lugdunensis]AMG63303.1 rod shape-determining protein MreD [Staphylococcus lugdunensis]ARB77618.1 rod shape-determining protein MreD [Staphylococcus lugdunensis]ARJ09134.1 rod shape-determining protein MreD [Staphylococcus lugdunensis]